MKLVCEQVNNNFVLLKEITNNLKSFLIFSAPNAYNAPVADKVLHENSPRYTFGNKVNVGKPLDTPGLFHIFKRQGSTNY